MAPDGPAPGRARRAAAILRKIAVVVLAVLVAAGVAGYAFVSSRHFGAAVETALGRWMLDTKQRTLRFDGPLELFFWPNVGFQVGHVSLSEPGGVQQFASLDGARFAVAAMPLLDGRVVVEDCRVMGLRAAVVKRRDGTLNLDDLISRGEPAAARFELRAASLKLDDAALSWNDEVRGMRVAASEVGLAIGGLQAAAAANGFRADDLSLSATLNGARLLVAASALDASATTVTAERIALDLDYRSAGTAIKGALAARLAADAARRTLALEQLTGSVDVVHPRLAHALRLPLRGAFTASPDAAGGELATRIDESNAVIKFALPRGAPAKLDFDVAIDRLDVDRYLAPGPAEAAGDAPAADFSALDGFELDGSARIGELRIAGVETRNIKLAIRGRHGKLDVRSKLSKDR